MKACRYCEATWHYSSQCFYQPNKQSKPCEFCGSNKHLSWQCYQNPKRKEQMKAKFKNGKVSMKWGKARTKWFKINEADHYVCYLCGKWLAPNETTLDHVIPRSRAPELRNDLNNLKPCCWQCNNEKGSKVLTDKE